MVLASSGFTHTHPVRLSSKAGLLDRNVSRICIPSEPFSERVGPSADPTAPSGRSYNPRQMTSDPIDLAPAVPSAPQPPPPPPRTLLRLRSLCRVQLGT